MRRQLEQLSPPGQFNTPDHLALAYDAWAPIDHVSNDKSLAGKVPVELRATWLTSIATIAISPDYTHSFNRWKKSFAAEGDRVIELQLASRLLVGHGNSSAIDVGLSVHHTWGVPFIPGSALKGLVAHYVEANYGPSDPSKAPWDQLGPERERALYQGVTWNGSRIERGPGEIYRALFGAPDASTDDAMQEHELRAGATPGLVTFHDALYVPDSTENNQPFAADVLTVHQKDYYDSSGGHAPSDYDSPNPVAFVTIRPKTRMLFALSGLPEWTSLAEKLLRDALEHWGVGGKTSAGYGRIEQPKRRRGGHTRKPGDRIEVELLDVKTKRGGWTALDWGSDVEGAIENSGEVPADKKPGDHVTVIVKIAKGKQSGLRYVGSDVNAKTSQGKK